ncbi:MAG: toll/interleukin-1 receptor domain-containing protein [Bacteroidetes bacterium]|nr:toll/interleukin-1 receptor domain-containing protein [Bacteroidota bacterium]
MAFVPGFEYDIFISYAHVDNYAFTGQSYGWIEGFYKNLNAILAKRFGRSDMVKIWWDINKLDGSVLFGQSIDEGIKNSAIMVCLLSHGYLKSDYCHKELELFCKKAKSEMAGLHVGNRSRIINVLLYNIPFSEWPPEISGISGFPFHDAKEAEGYGWTLDTDTEDFRNRLKKLSDAIYTLVNDLRKTVNQQSFQPDMTEKGNSSRVTIFMGDVSDPLRNVRKRTITDLEKKAFQIVTDIPPPFEADEHEQKIREALLSSDLSVHLLDKYPGMEIHGLPEGYRQKQTELGFDIAKPQMIWIPAETEINAIEEDRYKQFLQNLENGRCSGTRYEFIRGSTSSLSQTVVDFAEHIKQRRLQKPTDTGKVSVLLDTHCKDLVYAYDICKMLIENKIQPFVNPLEDDPRENSDILGERISQVTKVIFLYGLVSRDWVQERMNALLKYIITKELPIDQLILYMAPPRKEKNEFTFAQKFLKVKIIDKSSSACTDVSELCDLLRNQNEVAR